jgi:sugar porter (SP) family MFS transporter
MRRNIEGGNDEMNPTLLRGVLVGALAGLLFGFDTAVIAGTTRGLTVAFHLNPAGLGWTVSSALWGTLIGAAGAGIPGDRFGARLCLRVIAVLYIVSSVGCVMSTSWAALLAFRVIAGLAIGASSVLAPVYIAEIAPPARRGAMVGAFQFNIVFGILVAYLSNYLIGTLNLGVEEWRWKFGVLAAPAALLLGLLFTIPQSPRWLALKGHKGEAGDVLRKIGVSDVQGELDAVARAAGGPASSGGKLNWAKHRKPILLAFSIAAFNQLSGINAILYYLNDIFAAAGFSKVSSDLQSIIIGATNLAFTALALTIIDRFGRRNLLLVGAAGVAAALSGTAVILLTGHGQNLLLWMLIGFIAAFAFSQGAVIWVYISEIFPSDVRARGQGVGSSTHWFMDALIAWAFPIIAVYSKGAPFVFFAAMMVVQFFVVLRYFPETKRVALEDMAGAIG